MPELPEVETTRRGIAPHLISHSVIDVIVRNRRLRWPIPTTLAKHIKGQIIRAIDRRAKYLLFRFDTGILIMHLGMSGSLRLLPADTPVEKHDHVDFIFDNGQCLRFRDPRRFGSIHWTKRSPEQHKLLKDLGPEPLSDTFNTAYLAQQANKRKIAIKDLLMNSHVVVGVGNIYASEALFLAGIHPSRAAGRVSAARLDKLVSAIKSVLQKAIAAGGTTLRDFTLSDGTPGYFKQKLNVYKRTGEPCPSCQRPIKQIKLGQRSTFYCAHCQR
jgi:formamidopyrimidine-DNA glycosylase